MAVLAASLDHGWRHDLSRADQLVLRARIAAVPQDVYPLLL